MAKIASVKYLIIGNSAGGIGAAEAIREVDSTGAIAIVSSEPYPAYSRPLIAEYLGEGCPLERMLFRPPDFYEKNNIGTFLGRKVERLDLNEHVVVLDSGDEILWEKLLLAAGGLPIIPRVSGVERGGVFSFTTLDDAKAIDHYLNQISRRRVRAVVIGGGLIGVSVTEALVKRGVAVTIVEMKEWLLNTILDETASALEAVKLREADVKIITGHTVGEVTSYSSGTVTSVTLDDGTVIPCELVILAIGVRPRNELVAETGVKVNRGIVVDRHMATSHPDVYACGDVAEAYDFVYDECRLTPIWPNAYLGGKIAGWNMAGRPVEYPGGTAMNSLKYFGLDVASAGIVNPPDNSYEVLSRSEDSTYRKIVLKDGRLVGMVFVGNIEKSGIVFNLMKNKVNIEGFKQALIAEDFGLVSLPEELWRPRLTVPPSAVVSPVSVPEPAETVAGE